MTGNRRLIEKNSLSENLLARFGELLSQTPAAIPRVVSELRVKRVLLSLVEQMKGTGYQAVPAARLIEHLQNAGLVHPIAIDNRGKGVPAIYFLGLYGSGTLIDPVELLCAADSNRVICYSTAIAYYGLTTQLPTHHHAAQLRSHQPRLPRGVEIPPPPRRSPEAATRATESRVADPLGTRLFDYQGLHYYVSQRDSRFVPGVQRRQMGAAGAVRMTTLEQTLLDTLHKPLSCGGPAVVFEAWETGLPKLNEDRLAQHLASINDHVRTRRAGWMLERFGHQPRVGTPLARVLDASLNRNDDTGPEQPLPPLLPGVAHEGVDKKWGLQVPV